MKYFVRTIALALVALLAIPTVGRAQDPQHSIARQWNELLLEAIRNDFARPTVHARNLFHTSIAMWDAWAAYDVNAANYLHQEKAGAADVLSAREETISFACYRVIQARFATSPGAAETLAAIDAKMDELRYDKDFAATVGDTPAALGNRIAETILEFGRNDNANEINDYDNRFYLPVNEPLLPEFPGNPDITDVDRWQPLALQFFIDQAGNPFPTGVPPFLSPEWGAVTPFALTEKDRTVNRRDGFDYVLYHDPGPPPTFDGNRDEYRAGFEQVVEFSSKLDPTDGVMIDIGPGARGNSTLGTNDGTGHALNPATGQAYAPNVVPAGDYYRILAEFWADGPDSETPPGHWFVIANYVTDHPALERRLGGVGPVLDILEWDVKLYMCLAGAMHDVAIAAWGVKGWYDYIRPISAIRWMADQGQSTYPGSPGFDLNGISFIPDLIEVVTAETIAPGERHEHLAGPGNENLGKIALFAWRGPDFINDPETDVAGVGWILAENWWPYQRPSFVTPPFAGYVSGHSTYSRAAAAVMSLFTGDEFFPGGLGEFHAPMNEFLVFEDGPSQDVTLQWAKYFDAADECSLSRIYGGIHPRADDIPGRLMGAEIGPDAFAKAQTYFTPYATVTVERAKARRRKKGRGLITVKGRLETAVHGPTDALDVSNGLTLTVTYGPDVFELGRLGPDDCRIKKNGKILGRNGARTVKATFKPLKPDPTVYRFNIKLKVPTYHEPAVGPLTLQIHGGNAVRTGTANNCSVHGRNPRLSCFE